MRQLMIFLLVICLTHTSYAQVFINSTRSESKRILSRYLKKEKYNHSLNETASTLTFRLRDPKVQNLDVVLHFGKRKKCDTEVQIFSCDSCFQKQLNKTLATETYNWTKVGDNVYYSKFRYGIILTTGLDNPLSFMAKRNTLSKREYNQIIQHGKKI